jgi:hypothetical protein
MTRNSLTFSSQLQDKCPPLFNEVAVNIATVWKYETTQAKSFEAETLHFRSDKEFDLGICPHLM